MDAQRTWCGSSEGGADTDVDKVDCLACLRQALRNIAEERREALREVEGRGKTICDLAARLFDCVQWFDSLEVELAMRIIDAMLPVTCPYCDESMFDQDFRERTAEVWRAARAR